MQNIAIQHPKVKDSSLATTAYKNLIGSPGFIQTVSEQLIKAHGAGRKIIVITKTLDVAKKIKKYCKDRVKFDIADANFKKPLNDFKNGINNVLVATVKLVGEGVDLPDADCLFILTQHSSPVVTYQTVGRVLRKSPTKKQPLIVDFVATTGYKQFENASQKRLEEYQCVTNNIHIR